MILLNLTNDFFSFKRDNPLRRSPMKIPELFDFDKRLIDRLVKSNPSHKSRINEYIEQTKDVYTNLEILQISDMLPSRLQKEKNNTK